MEGTSSSHEQEQNTHDHLTNETNSFGEKIAASLLDPHTSTARRVLKAYLGGNFILVASAFAGAAVGAGVGYAGAGFYIGKMLGLATIAKIGIDTIKTWINGHH